jgi:tetratricopeptide (TPR) repeat protein
LPTWRAGAALALIESGREEEARELALAEDFQKVRWDDTWAISMLHWADACSRLGDRGRAAELYELLAPFSGQLASAAGLTVAGSTDWALGTLAATLERYEQAIAHYRAAEAIETRLGAPLLLARTHVCWARALIARGRPQDLEQARSILDRAEATAEGVGAQGITRDVMDGRSELATVGSHG